MAREFRSTYDYLLKLQFAFTRHSGWLRAIDVWCGCTMQDMHNPAEIHVPWSSILVFRISSVLCLPTIVSGISQHARVQHDSLSFFLVRFNQDIRLNSTVVRWTNSNNTRLERGLFTYLSLSSHVRLFMHIPSFLVDGESHFLPFFGEKR